MSDKEAIEDSLTPRQVMFCREYIIDMNATQAYIRAGYSENGADVSGSRLLSNARIKAVVDQFKKERADRLLISADYALARIRHNLEAAAEAEKFSDVNKAGEILLRHLGELTEKVDMSVTSEESMMDKMRRARERIESGVKVTGEAQGPDIQKPLNPDEGEAPE